MLSQFAQQQLFDRHYHYYRCCFLPPVVKICRPHSQSMFVVLWIYGTIVNLQEFVNIYLLYVIGIVVGAKVGHHQFIVFNEGGNGRTKYNNSAISNLDCNLDKIYLTNNIVFIMKYIYIFQNKTITFLPLPKLLLIFQICIHNYAIVIKHQFVYFKLCAL